MKKAKFSQYDNRGKLYVDCSECNRGGNGGDPDKCSAGHSTKKGQKGGCFCGDLLPNLTVEKVAK